MQLPPHRLPIFTDPLLTVDQPIDRLGRRDVSIRIGAGADERRPAVARFTDVADAFLGRCRCLPRILISNKGCALFLNLRFDRPTHASVGDVRSNILRGGIETVRHRLRMARSQRRGVRARGIALFVKCQPHARKVGCRRRRLLVGTELAVDLFPLLQRAAKLPNALANARAEILRLRQGDASRIARHDLWLIDLFLRHQDRPSRAGTGLGGVIARPLYRLTPAIGDAVQHGGRGVSRLGRRLSFPLTTRPFRQVSLVLIVDGTAMFGPPVRDRIPRGAEHKVEQVGERLRVDHRVAGLPRDEVDHRADGDIGLVLLVA
ncbi:hypothetical protein EMGR_006138 [Emarellia grisea]